MTLERSGNRREAEDMTQRPIHRTIDQMRQAE